MANNSKETNHSKNEVTSPNFTKSAEKIVKILLNSEVNKLVIIFGPTIKKNNEKIKETRKNVAVIRMERLFEQLVITWSPAFKNNESIARSFVKEMLVKAILELPD